MAAAGAVAGVAASYGASAFSYNQARFQFNGTQRQIMRHQQQNMKLQRWALFREDVREIFALTISNMSTYMVAGALFLGFSVNFVWQAGKDFPKEPPWLCYLWGNSLFSALAYGFLAVWFAMHGSVVAHSGNVKLLTQAVRPPIPTDDDIEAVRHKLEMFEKSGADQILRFPNFVGSNERPIDDSVQGDGTAGAAYQERSGSDARDDACAFQRYLDRMLGSTCGRPGPTAANSGHINLVKQHWAEYACFDAYSRVSLSVASNNLLYALAYFMLAHLMARTDAPRAPIAWFAVIAMVFTSTSLMDIDLSLRRPMQHVSIKACACAGPLLGCLTAQLWRIGDASSTWRFPRYVASILVAIVCICHATWLLLFTIAVRPSQCSLHRSNGEAAEMPGGFRSVRYLDVFGWLAPQKQHQLRPENAIGDPGSFSGDEHNPRSDPDAVYALGRAHALMASISRVVGLSSHLSAEDLARLQALKDDLSKHATSLEEGMASIPLSSQYSSSSPFSMRVPAPSSHLTHEAATDDHVSQTSDFGSWLRCECESDIGFPVQYFVHSRTGEVRWDPPVGGNIIDLQDIELQTNWIAQRSERLNTSGEDRFAHGFTRQSSNSSIGHVSGRRFFNPFKALRWLFSDSSKAPSADVEMVERLRMPTLGAFHAHGSAVRNVVQKHASGNRGLTRPWKHFKQVSRTQILLWIGSAAYLFLAFFEIPATLPLGVAWVEGTVGGDVLFSDLHQQRAWASLNQSLDSLGMRRFKEPLALLGVESASDLQYVSDADLSRQIVGLRLVHIRKLRKTQHAALQTTSSSSAGLTSRRAAASSDENIEGSPSDEAATRL